MKKYGGFFTFLIFALFLPLITYASEISQNGHYWQSLPKSERVAFCSALISKKEGVGVYPKEVVELSAEFFAGRINYFYKTHSLDDPIPRAESWAYPETKKMLDGLSSKDKKAINKKTTQKNSVAEPKKYPTGIGSIKLGDSERTVYREIKKSKYIKFPEWCENPGFNKWLRSVKEVGVFSERGTPCQGAISLFGYPVDFDTYWKFSKTNRLYQINLKAYIGTHGQRINDEEYKLHIDQTMTLSKKIIEVYTQKYNEPFYSNVKAFPNKDDNNCPYVARWQFPNEVLIDVYVCDLKEYRDSKYGRYNLIISITDQKEFAKVKADEKKQKEKMLKKEKEQEIKELKKTKGLL